MHRVVLARFAGEGLAQTGEELGPGMQSRHFVLVLDGQNLEVVAGGGQGHRQGRVQGRLGLAQGFDALAVAAGQGGVLVVRQFLFPQGQHFLQGGVRPGRRRVGGRRCQLAYPGLVHGGAAAPVEGLEIGRHGGAVELDGPAQGRQAHRHQAFLPGVAEEEHVGIQGVAHEGRGQGLGVEEPGVVGAHGGGHRLLHAGQGELPVRVAGEFGGGGFRAVHHGPGAPFQHLGQGLVACRHHHVAAQDGVRLAGGDAGGVDVLRPVGEAQVGEHGAVLLGQTGHVQHRDALAVQVGGHADEGAQGHHAGAADPRHQQVVGPRRGRQHGLGQGWPVLFVHGQGLALFQLRPFQGDEGGAEALEAGEILVAVGLVDGPLAPEIGFHRDDREAVGLHRAVAAALAHRLVDEDPAVHVGQLAPLAAPPLFRGAGLVVDEDGGTGNFPQFPLHRVQLVPVAHRHVGRQVRHLGVFLRLVGDDHHPAHPFGLQLAGDAGHGEDAVHRLAAGHGHGVVVEDLVGDVGFGRHRLADGQQAGVEVGAVPQVGEDVFFFGEGRLADPGDALAAHVGEGGGAAVHPGHHVVAADAGHGPGAFRHPGGGVVGAAGAEVGRALGEDQGRLQGLLLGLDEVQAGLDGRAGEVALDAAGDGPGDLGHGQFAGCRQQPVAVGQVALAVGQQGPFALLVELAHHPGPHVLAPVVELFLQLVFQHLALLFHHQDFVQPLGELAHPFRFQGPDHAHLVEADADLGGQLLVDAQFVQGLHHVQIGLAGGDDAQAWRRGVDDDAVEPVGPGVGEGGVELEVGEAGLLHQGRVGPADVEAVGRQFEIIRQADVQGHGVHPHRGRGFHRVRQGLEGHPAARIAAHGPAVQAVFQVLLDVGRIQHRHHHRLEDVLGLVGQGGGLGGVVVAGHHQHSAVPGAAGGVGVAEDVAAAVHPRALAVPQGKHPVVLGAGEEIDLLAAPDGGGGQVLIDPGLEGDVVFRQIFLGFPQALVQTAERAAPVAGNEAGSVEPLGLVPQPLQHGQADQGLGAGEKGAAGKGGVLVVQAGGRQLLGDVQREIAHAICSSIGRRRLAFIPFAGGQDRVGRLVCPVAALWAVPVLSCVAGGRRRHCMGPRRARNVALQQARRATADAMKKGAAAPLVGEVAPQAWGGRILPGFIRLRGSRAVFRVRIRATPSSPCSCSR